MGGLGPKRVGGWVGLGVWRIKGWVGIFVFDLKKKFKLKKKSSPLFSLFMPKLYNPEHRPNHIRLKL